MIPEQIIASLLVDSAEVAALVADRVYPGLLPEGVQTPAIVYRRIDAIVLHRPLAGTGASLLCRARMRVFVLTPGDDYVAAKALMSSVRRACANRLGTIAGFANAQVGQPMLSPEMPDPIVGLNVEATDFMVTFHEPLS